MAEYIDRQAVLDDLANLWDWDSVDGIQTSTALKQVITDVKNVPAADVRENKQGEWIEYFDDYGINYRCSACGKATHSAKQYDLRGNEYVYAYCPNCGADMRGEQNERIDKR